MVEPSDIRDVASVDAVTSALAGQDYLADEGIAGIVYLADRLGKPIIVEGPAGTGKTELAKCVAEVTGARLIRLQCYEGLDINHAVYEWNHARQLLEISGDAHSVAVMRDFVRSLQPDFEEQLSSLIGDIPARQAGNQIRSFAEWAEQVGQSIAVNTGEYLTEEKQLLVVRPRIDRFLIAVNQLRNDTEQLARRLGTLEKVERKGG